MSPSKARANEFERVPTTNDIFDSGRGGYRGAIGVTPPKTYENNFIHHAFVQ